jgi:sensor c-di-GMP phosphodiesterase-like protein
LIRNDSRVKYILLLPLGAAAGLVASLPIALRHQQRAGEAELRGYAERVLKTEEAVAGETQSAIETVSGDRQAFCSDGDLAVMRAFVFNASVVRDIGRVKDGHLLCTSMNGRLPVAVPLGQGDIAVGDAQVYGNRPLSLMSPHSTGIMVVSGDISVVLNRESLNELDSGPLLSTGVVLDRAHGRVFRVFGHDEPLSYAEAAAQVPVVRGGMYYLPLCSKQFAACVVAEEKRDGMYRRHREELAGYLVYGALLGNTLASVVLVLLVERGSLEWRLRRAIRLRKLACAYQPIIDLDSGECVGAEALARWVTDSGESIPPKVFVPVAEQKEFVGALTRLVLDRVLSELPPLLRRGHFRIAINIGAQDLAHPEFLEELEQSVRRAGISPSAFALELTEHSAADLESAKTAIARLRQTGFAVYIDDFGTGYSSLSYLQDLRVDAIKIDRVFTQTVGTDAATSSVVPQILEIAQRLGLTVIAEGIEKEEQAAYFRNARPGVRGQGWLLGRPMPAEEFMSRYGDKASGRAILEQTKIP